MDWQSLGGALAGVGAVFGGLRRFSGKSARLRTRIEHDMQLLEKLAPGSAGRRELEQHIDQSVRDLVALERDEDKRRTDPYGLIWLVIFVALAVGAGTTALRNPYDWRFEIALWVAAGFLVVLTLVGATVTFNQKPKDEQP